MASSLPLLQRKKGELDELLKRVSIVSRGSEAGKIANQISDIAMDLESVYALDRNYEELEKLYRRLFEKFRKLPAKFGDNRTKKKMKSVLESFSKKYTNWSNIHKKQKLVQRNREIGMQNANAGNHKKALRLLDRALKRGDEIRDKSQIIEALYDKASVFLDKGSFEAAMQIYKSLAKMDNSGRAWFYMGYIYGQLKQPKRAILYYQKYLEINPWESVTLGNIGWTYELLNDLQKALMYYDLSLEIDPRSIDVLLSKGKLLRRMGNDKEAMSYFDTALRFDPNNIDALTNKVILLDVLKDVRAKEEGEKAIKIFESIIEKNPKDADILVRKGIILDVLHRPKEAIKCYDEALSIDPRNDFALYNKACTTNLHGNKDEALRLLKRAFDINPSYKELAKHDIDLLDLHDNSRFKSLLR